MELKLLFFEHLTFPAFLSPFCAVQELFNARPRDGCLPGAPRRFRLGRGAAGAQHVGGSGRGVGFAQ